MAKVINENIENTENINYKLQDIENKLTGLGYKFTGPRKIILTLLLQEHRLLDADYIYMAVKKVDSKIGIATVYRTLELLARLNLICRISIGVDKSLYMLSDDCGKDTSVYMICDNCGRAITNNACLNSSIKIRLRDDAEKNILKNCGLRIADFRIIFTGLCDQCVDDSNLQR